MSLWLLDTFRRNKLKCGFGQCIFEGALSEVIGFSKGRLLLGLAVLFSQAFFRDLLELLKPLFTGDLKHQPCYVADTGSLKQQPFGCWKMKGRCFLFILCSTGASQLIARESKKSHSFLRTWWFYAIGWRSQLPKTTSQRFGMFAKRYRLWWREFAVANLRLGENIERSTAGGPVIPGYHTFTIIVLLFILYLCTFFLILVLLLFSLTKAVIVMCSHGNSAHDLGGTGNTVYWCPMLSSFSGN